MDIRTWTAILVIGTFALYIGIAVWSRARSTGDFYVAAKKVHPIANGAATAADWMSAASFISMAGLISFLGRDGAMYLMGWTGGYVLLAMLLAPYLRKFGKYTVPDFIGERYYSDMARTVAAICGIFVSFTYVAGQMRGVGVVFSRFLEVDINLGVAIGMAIVFFYAVLGGMKGITYTQVAQYTVLIFAYLVPAIFLSVLMTGNPIPQLGFGGETVDGSGYLLTKLDALHRDLGLADYTARGPKSMIDVFMITFALMVGTAGLPHVIIRFFTVPKVADARKSAAWALLFIALLYTTAPAVAAFARTNMINSVHNVEYKNAPSWFKNWENTKLIAWYDKNADGKIQYGKGKALSPTKPKFTGKRGSNGEQAVSNKPTKAPNEIYIDRDIMVLANPEIGGLPNWVIALVAAGGLAAALSTAAGLLLVISTSLAHDLLKKVIMKGNLDEKKELLAARVAAGIAVIIAGLFGIYPPAFVAQVVAFAFGLAASSFFPPIIMGIFSKKMNKEGAVSGMIAGIVLTAAYIIYFKFINPGDNNAKHWWFGISPEGIGTLGMLLNFAVATVVSKLTADPPEDIQHLVENIRVPRELEKK